ncbi:hypothetical protein DEEACLCL_00116 [Salmonella phage CRW-SP2]|nr:hypothetical protein DEEACLCL_00116 [Salmonella phage CRW-SP2]
MIPILETIKTLRNTQGTNAKKEFLVKAFKEIPELEEFLQYVYDPMRSYYRTNLDLNAFPRMLSRSLTSKWEDVYSVLDEMAERRLSGKKADSELAKVAIPLDPGYHELIQMILDRDIKAGIAEKGINSAYSTAMGFGSFCELIEVLPYHRYDNMTIDLLKKMDFKKGVYSQLKSDGMFANIICRNGLRPKIRSRSGSLIAGGSLDNLTMAFDNIVEDSCLGDSVFHGELLVIDLHDNKVLPRAVGNGKINSVIQTGEALDDRYQVVYRVWDVVPYEQWKNKERVDTPYSRRFDIIRQLFDGEGGLVQVQETRVVHSFEEAVEHFKDALARNEEGTICKSSDMPWEDGTSSEGLKLKMEIECELEIVGFNEADKKGKHSKTFGSLLCKTSDGLLLVGVSGLSDAERQKMWDNQADYVGKIAGVLSNGVQDKTEDALKSLFLPRFIDIRLDKKEANTLAEVYAIQKAYVENILVLLEAA